MTLAEKTIEIALSQKGATEHPPGSNRGPEVDEYLRCVGLDASRGNYPWCAAFVTWCIAEAVKAVGGPPRFRGSASALLLRVLNKPLILPGPAANCVFVMDHGQGKGHTGFVLGIDPHDPTLLHTVEGNTDASGSRTGGQVMVRTRHVADCVCFIFIG
jgi:hypothetical protein